MKSYFGRQVGILTPFLAIFGVARDRVALHTSPIVAPPRNTELCTVNPE